MPASAVNTPPEDAPAAAPQASADLPLVADAAAAAPCAPDTPDTPDAPATLDAPDASGVPALPAAAAGADAAAEPPPAAEPVAGEPAAPAMAAHAVPAGRAAEAEAADAVDAAEAADAVDAADATAAAPATPGPPALPAVPELAPAACAAALAERFPALFGSARALPLKLRIQADIQARAPGVFTKKSLSIFLHRHTTSTAYLRALVNTPTRHDLDGLPAGEVADEHRAAAEVERRRAIVDARRQAERDAQRQAARGAQRPAAGPAAPAGAPREGRRGAPHRPPRVGDQASEHAGEHAARAQGRRAPPFPRSGPSAPPREPLAGTDGAPPPAAEQRQAAAIAAPADLAPRPVAAPSAPQFSPVELEARRERAALLRAYESSTLTRANFCVLKRISEADLQAQLVLAGQEREPRAQEPRPQQRAEARPVHGAWRNEGGPRPDRGTGDASRGARAPQGRPPGKPPR